MSHPLLIRQCEHEVRTAYMNPDCVLQHFTFDRAVPSSMLALEKILQHSVLCTICKTQARILLIKCLTKAAGPGSVVGKSISVFFLNFFLQATQSPKIPKSTFYMYCIFSDHHPET